ncbi:ankyrin repeat domain-containing protein [Streptomyces tsukubensis]|uniref:Uncharacterized protein n=1 Tax=Streptomyces tsukubensis TaxID=83656 RepID=A0A1V3ZZ47_9ACTN|nr:ankyrin repeat domain-containing protein [Streptomyces tsukubensis]OON71724.1 hypothetical protein B1H18_32560 [Streptomyces tsukubensis]QFR93076.1 hypothetical protein GBW32_08320 [Streptomyces tsukubensis]
MGTSKDGIRTVDANTLFDAVYEGDQDAVTVALRAGVSAESVDEDGQTALYLASVHDDPGVVRLLLAAGADPERLSCGADLPLCGAACAGHTGTVRALLSAGAAPDRPEGFGFTALNWAARLGDEETARVLLAAGADPDLAVPGNPAPLVCAARRGDLATVRALLRGGAGDRREALAEAVRLLRADVEREMTEGLLAAHDAQWGPDDRDRCEVVVRKVGEAGGVTVVVDLHRDGLPVAGEERGTAHGAIATLLERESGVATPYGELAARALRDGVRGRGGDNWTESVRTLLQCAGEETLQAAVAWCAPGDPLRRVFGTEVLGGLRPVDADCVPLLRELAAEEGDPALTAAAVDGLGSHGDPAGAAEILRRAGHQDAGVRAAVARALAGGAGVGAEAGSGAGAATGTAIGPRSAAVAALVPLADDLDPAVRAAATTALAAAAEDSDEVRAALARRLTGPSPDVVAEAARGLARRGDPRAVDALAGLLAEAPAASPVRVKALDALTYLPDPKLRRRLRHTRPRLR